MKKLFLSVAMVALALLSASAQTTISEEMAYKIKSEAFDKSSIDGLSEYMTDLLGSRLAGSQQMTRAEQLVVQKLKDMGLSNPRIEWAFDMDKGGWDSQKNYVAMTAPYYCSFAANPKAWSGSTKGLVKGEVVVVNVQSEADLDNYKGKLAGKIALMPVTQTYEIDFNPLAYRYTDEQLDEIATDNRPEGYNFRRIMQGGGGMPSREQMMRQRELQQKTTEMLQKEGVLCIINTRGTFNVTSGTGTRYKIGDPEPAPEIILPLEDGGRMYRLIQSGQKVEMELELKNEFTDNKKINNVIAEIPGTDPKLKNEVVLIGAHLDSWHSSTGGADNSSGCIVMMEAMRILKDLGVQPKRTIRIALWGGEEQGLYGSRGYMENNIYNLSTHKVLPGYDKFALYLNMDNGSGRFRGIYLEHNDLAKPYFAAWMKPIENLGFKTLSPRSTGSTDHVTFNNVGLPAYQFIQDELEYERTYHTNMDTWERLSLDDLKVDACMVAILALSAANDSGRIPLKPGYPEAAANARSPY